MPTQISFRAAALIIRGNRLLAAKNVNYPCYYTIGGGIELNESSDEAIVREIYEETGLKLEVDKLAIIQERFCTVNGQTHHEVVFFYLMKPGDGINILDNSFTDQGTKEILHWLPVDELSQIDIVPEFLKTKDLSRISAGIEHIITRE